LGGKGGIGFDRPDTGEFPGGPRGGIAFVGPGLDEVRQAQLGLEQSRQVPQDPEIDGAQIQLLRKKGSD
jgi:hypothetical protein